MTVEAVFVPQLVKSHPITEENLAQYASGSYFMDQVSKSQSGYEHEIYSNVFTSDDGKIVIQYWFFYVCNGPLFLGIGEHEGDWEMIEISRSVRPSFITVQFAFFIMAAIPNPMKYLNI